MPARPCSDNQESFAVDITLLIAFITTTLLFVAAPGPSVAFATAQALRHGTRGACVTVAGDALGTVVHITIAASSLTALIGVAARGSACANRRLVDMTLRNLTTSN